MNIDISKYPSIIARPYILSQKDTPQRKDYQRFLLENMISFLALLSVANILEFYENLQKKLSIKNNTEKKIENEHEISYIYEKISNDLIIDLKQMSLGKWNQLLRDTTRLFGDNLIKKELFMPELFDFYHGSCSEIIQKRINELIAIRNQDAHGNPIAEERLKNELDRRQAILNPIIEALNFLNKYQFIILDKFEIQDNIAVYTGKEQIYDGFTTCIVKPNSSLPTHEIIAYNKDTFRFLKLSPFLIYAPIDDQNAFHIAIYSKIEKEKDKLKALFISLDGHSMIDFNEFDKKFNLDLSQRIKMVQQIYADPKNEPINTPAITGSLKIQDEVLKVGDQSLLSISFKNKKSTDLYDCKAVILFPNNFEILQNNNVHISIDDSSKQLVKFNFQELNNNTEEKITIDFIPHGQGHFLIRPSIMTYKYYLKESHRESGKKEDADIEIEGVQIEVRDPNSKDKMQPLINVYRKAYPLELNQNYIEIGQPFIFEIKLHNIGFGAAKDVKLEIVFPPEFCLVDGVEELKTTLNPEEDRTFKYSLTCQKPGIYKITIRSIAYYDALGIKYATHSDGDYWVLVKSDILTIFKYQLKEAYDDIYLSDDEKKIIQKIREENPHITDNKMKELEQDILVAAFREIIKSQSTKRNFIIKEEIYNEKEWQRPKNQRRSIIYSFENLPFFAIDITDINDILLYSLETPLSKIPEFKHGKLYVTEGSFALREFLTFSNVKSNSMFGKKHFNRWISSALNTLQNEYLPWLNLSRHIAEEYGAIRIWIERDLFNLTFSEKFTKILGLEATPIRVMKDYNSPSKYTIILHINNYHYTVLQKKRNTVENEKLKYMAWGSQYQIEEGKIPSSFKVSARITRHPGIEITIKDDSDIKEALEHFRKLMKIVVYGSSIAALEHPNFKHRYAVKILTSKLEQLFDAEIALSFIDNIIGIYSIAHHTPGNIESKQCIGFISPYYSYPCHIGFLLYKSHKTSSRFDEMIKFVTWWNVLDRKRWLYYCCDKDGDPIVNEIIDILIDTVSAYSPDAIAIWPAKIKKEIVIDNAKKDYRFLHLIQLLLEGISRYLDIETEFAKNNIHDLKAVLDEFTENFTSKRLESPIELIENKGRKEIQISKGFIHILTEMHKEDPTFISFIQPDCPSLITKYLFDLRKAHPVLSTIYPYKDYIEKNINIPGKISCYFYVNLKNHSINAYFEVTSDKETFAHILEQAFHCLSISSNLFEKYKVEKEFSFEKKLYIILKIQDQNYQLLQNEDNRKEIIEIHALFFNLLESQIIKARTDAMLGFWELLENKLKEKGYIIENEGKYSQHLVDAYYRNKIEPFGIILKIYDEAEGFKIIFYLALIWRLYYGLGLKGESAYLTDDLKLKLNLMTNFTQIFYNEYKILGSNECFKNIIGAGWKYPSIYTDFYNQNEAAAKMMNPEYRENYTNKLIEEIEAIIRIGKIWYCLDHFYKNVLMTISFKKYGIEAIKLSSVYKKWGRYGCDLWFTQKNNFGQWFFFGVYFDSADHGIPLKKINNEPELAFFFDINPSYYEKLKNDNELIPCLHRLEKLGFENNITKQITSNHWRFIFKRIPLSDFSNWTYEGIRQYVEEIFNCLSNEEIIRQKFFSV
ncbi:MAG: hypothetical protein HQK79_22610 [Desulfobacterales bacterium]|nr:hypothetical protein [Desulfobacterales bacterium]